MILKNKRGSEMGPMQVVGTIILVILLVMVLVGVLDVGGVKPLHGLLKCTSSQVTL